MVVEPVVLGVSTSIEWTGETWNPTTGCDRVSSGCDRCYALTMAGRLKLMGQAKYQRDGNPETSGPGFGLTLHPDVLDAPFHTRKPTTYFVNSMSDLFHKDVPDEFIANVFAVMAQTPRHTYQILTKRPQRMAAWVNAVEQSEAWWSHNGRKASKGGIYIADASTPWPLPNVWAGTSIESNRYTWRANHLRSTPAAVRFLSLEPLLGPLPSLDLTGIDWVIVGAESGRGARPMDEGWVREIKDRCVELGIPFFFKQKATPAGRKISLPMLDDRTWAEMPEREQVG